MNKRAEITITLGLLVSIIFLSVSTAILKIEFNPNKAVSYVADNKTGIAYNLNSTNKNCNLDNIIIEKDNLIFIIEQKELKKYNLDKRCN